MKLPNRRRLSILLLLLWIGVGAFLRFTNLTEKPLWTDEFSTIIFSLGNSYTTVPLDQIITPDQLLFPLHPEFGSDMRAVVRYLFTESNHPPLFFVLTHFWLKLFPAQPDGLVSVWAVRSLPALFGVFTIPATFALGWLSFRSRLVAHIAAALMATSPFGVYLAQEARHYTLPVLWVIASLCCLAVAARSIRDRQLLPRWICAVWIVVNTLGVATHYFFLLTLGAEVIVVASMGLVQSWREQGIWHPASYWWRIWIVAIGTIAGSLVWLPLLQEVQDSELTQWLYRNNWAGLGWLTPLGQALAGWVTMIYLLPIQAASQAVAAISGVGLVLLVLWTLPKLYRGLQVQYLERDSRLAVMVLSEFVVGAIVLIFLITYLLNVDLTSAFRYNFVFFPAAIVLVGAGLASGWNIATKIAQAQAAAVPPLLLQLARTCGKKTIALICLLSLLGGLTVILNLGYQKTHRPDVVAEAIEQDSTAKSVLITIAHRTTGQTGRLMGIAWALKHAAEGQGTEPGLKIKPFYLLAHYSQSPKPLISTLRQSLNRMPRPLDLWMVNYQGAAEDAFDPLFEEQSCVMGAKPQSVDGYRYRLYRCIEVNPLPPIELFPDSRNSSGSSKLKLKP